MTHSDKIRILQVLSGLNRGGAETTVMEWYRSIDRDRMQFDFAVTDRPGGYAFEPEAASLGARVYRMPQATGSLVKYYRSWNKLLREHAEIDAVHGHYHAPAALYLGIARRRGIPTIAHGHTAGSLPSTKSFVKKASTYPIRYVADRTMACSRSAATWMFGARSATTTVIPNPVDTARFRFSRRTREVVRSRLGVADRFVIGHVGSYTPPKNHARLIEIFAQYRLGNPNAHLMLVGEGVLLGQEQERAKALHVYEHVSWLGAREDIPDLLGAMDVFVMPSVFEGFPVAAVEAQTNGLPCILSDAITNEIELSPGVAFVSLNRSNEEWVQAINCARPDVDRTASAEIVQSAGLGPDAIGARIQRFYLELLDQRGGPRKVGQAS